MTCSLYGVSQVTQGTSPSVPYVRNQGERDGGIGCSPVASYDTRDDVTWAYLALNCADLPLYGESISSADCREAVPPDCPHDRHVEVNEGQARERSPLDDDMQIA